MRKMGKTVVVLLVLAASLSCIIGNASAWGFDAISADANGIEKNDFEVGETVYAAMYLGNEDTTVRVYIVNDNDWAGGEVLTDVTDNDFEEVIVTTVAGEDVYMIRSIWTPGSDDVGLYDIVLDSNGNGELDGLDKIDSQFGVGFSVHVPEFATIAMPVGAILGLLFFFNHRKHKKE